MSVRAAVAAALIVTTGLAPQAFAAPTSPDSGFAGDGVLIIHSASHDEFVSDLAVLPDGRTMVVLATNDDPGMEVRRLRANGTPDPTFGGGDGLVTLGGADDYEEIHLVVDAQTGKSYVTAFVDGAPFPTTVWRLTPGGAPDPTFGGGDGEVTFVETNVRGIAALPGGKLVMVGDDFNVNTANAWRLTNTGALDPAFGMGGTVVLSADTNDSAAAVVRQPDGKLLIAGSHYNPTTSTLLAFRLREGGAFDTKFSGDGKAVLNPSSPGVTTSTVWPPELLLRPDGRTVWVAGLNQNDGGFRNATFVAGLTAKGKNDPRFATSVLTQIMAGDGDAALQRDGKFIVTGVVPPLPSTTTLIARFTASGALDPTWSGDGLFPLPGVDGSTEVDILPTGRVMLGRTIDTGSIDAELRALKGTKTPRCRGKLATQFGSKSADTLKGTSGRDVLVGRGGKDKIKGRGGKDRICGNGRADKLFGGNGRDVLYGQAGNDLLVGGKGKDRLVGGPGNNTLKP